MPAARETVIGKFVNQILFKVDKSSINEAKVARMKMLRASSGKTNPVELGRMEAITLMPPT